jgi:hypothetical protein
MLRSGPLFSAVYLLIRRADLYSRSGYKNRVAYFSSVECFTGLWPLATGHWLLARNLFVPENKLNPDAVNYTQDTTLH